MNKIGKNVIRHSFKDKALMDMTPYPSDAIIEVETCDCTLGDVAKWMASWGEEDIPNITKENYRTYHKDNDRVSPFDRWNKEVIVDGGDLCYYVAGPNDTHRCKDAHGYNWSKEYPIDTPWIDMIADYIDANWDNEVHVVSFYSGCQGLISITVYDVKGKCALFSLGSSNEMFGHFRAR